MSELKPLICPQCGATINRETYVCEYCGTKFKKDYDPFDTKVNARLRVLEPTYRF